MKTLDLDAVQAFALVASLANFTRAAEASGTTQAAVSLKLKRLESFLAGGSLERTPRSVRLTVEGEAFLEHRTNSARRQPAGPGTVGTPPYTDFGWA
jgi:DNA-binding transcriptional LysR family regulator